MRCLSFELAMMKVMPYDPNHEEVYNVFIINNNNNNNNPICKAPECQKTEPKTAFFSAKPTETDRQETF